MGNNLIRNTLALVGGATVGAAVMFILDPSQGERRRRALADSTSRAAGGVTDRIHDTAKPIVDQARAAVGSAQGYARRTGSSWIDGLSHAAESVAHHASDLFNSGRKAAGDFASGAVSAAHEYGDKAAGAARSWRDSATDEAQDGYGRAVDAYGRARARAGRAAGFEPTNSYATATGITAGTIGIFAIGAGVMYFFDPQRGRSRRAMVRDQFVGATNRTGKRVRSAGRHLRNQAEGYVAKAGRLVPENVKSAVENATEKVRGQVSEPSVAAE